MAEDEERDTDMSPVIVIGESESEGSGDEPQIHHVHKVTKAELRRRKIETARRALRRTTQAVPHRPPPRPLLLSVYKCPICLRAPKNASVTSCGHVFCGECLYNSLLVQMRRNGLEWDNHDWLGAMGDPAAQRGDARHAGYNSNLFTPFGSSGAMALANAAGVSASSTRGIFNELVSRRHAQEELEGGEPVHGNTSSVRSRARASNGTTRLRGPCPVCRSPIQGGFTGFAKRGVVGLNIMTGVPAGSEPDDAPSSSKRRCV
ncbi:hypothetical protein MVES_002879 [Malassezia vespertilionis]|uniref:RING-type domain-containing protein n=1 Tax=Malassezia vespertilionis TaxID=2020962 RepID=A0A2N1J9L8_9BASI|nr:hypothetical protein MVES_002879 [Malassezia vespertilionis]